MDKEYIKRIKANGVLDGLEREIKSKSKTVKMYSEFLERKTAKCNEDLIRMDTEIQTIFNAINDIIELNKEYARIHKIVHPTYFMYQVEE